MRPADQRVVGCASDRWTGRGPRPSGRVWAVDADRARVVVTYSRIDADRALQRAHGGIAAGSAAPSYTRTGPVALVAIVLVLDRDRRAAARGPGGLAGPSIALCATMPLIVSQAHLDARLDQRDPGRRRRDRDRAHLRRRASGRARRSSRGCRGDPVRIVVAAVVLVLSLPWIAAELGFYVPGHVSSRSRSLPAGTETARGRGSPRRAPRLARRTHAPDRARCFRVSRRTAGSARWRARPRYRGCWPATGRDQHRPGLLDTSRSSSAARSIWSDAERLSIPVLKGVDARDWWCVAWTSPARLIARERAILRR